MDAKADLSLRWAHMPFCWFYHEVAPEVKVILKHTISNIRTGIKKDWSNFYLKAISDKDIKHDSVSVW